MPRPDSIPSRPVPPLLQGRAQHRGADRPQYVGVVVRPGPGLLIVGGPQPLVEEAARLGIDTVLLLKPPPAGSAPATAAPNVVPVDYDDMDAALPVVAERHAQAPFARVLSLTEPGLLAAARLGLALGLPGNSPDTVKVLGDKAAMRRLLLLRGLSPVEWTLARDAAHIAGFVEQHGPAIAKPLDGTGSSQVHLVRRRPDAAVAWEALRRAGHGTALVEEYLEGPEVSAEGFTWQGRHHVYAVTDKRTSTNFVEAGHDVPSTLPRSEVEAVAALVREVLDAVGLEEGVSHTEVKVTTKGPRVIESHPRIGGDKIRLLVGHAYGVDLLRAAIAVPFGLEPLPPAALARPSGAASIRFVTPTPGLITHIDTPVLAEGPGLSSEIELGRQVGDLAPEVRGSDDRSGWLLVRARTPAQARSESDRMLAETVISTTASGGGPARPF